MYIFRNPDRETERDAGEYEMLLDMLRECMGDLRMGRRIPMECLERLMPTRGLRRLCILILTMPP